MRFLSVIIIITLTFRGKVSTILVCMDKIVSNGGLIITLWKYLIIVRCWKIFTLS